MSILLTGGAGYIGAHCCVSLLDAGHDVIVLDDFSNATPVVFDRIEAVTGKRPTVITGDIRDSEILDTLFTTHSIDAVIHMAGLKAVGESVQKPLLYYAVNVEGSRTLIAACLKHSVHHFIFSSSATVYGDPDYLPLDEAHTLRTASPYGETKRVVEDMLRAVTQANPDFNIGILRYFNPIGAHDSGLIGEDPQGYPNNLLPFVAQVAIGHRPHVNVYGDDYPTPDGTGVRDYIHVMDLARAHKKTLDYMQARSTSVTLNLGTGEGSSVLEVIEAFRVASGQPIPIKMAPKRAGDVPAYYTTPAKAKALIDWETRYDLAKMCEDHWRWQKQNPNGYKGPAPKSEAVNTPQQDKP